MNESGAFLHNILLLHIFNVCSCVLDLVAAIQMESIIMKNNSTQAIYNTRCTVGETDTYCAYHSSLLLLTLLSPNRRPGHACTECNSASKA